MRLTWASGTLAPICRRRGTGWDRRGSRRRREGSAVELEFTSEQEELRSSVRSFLDKECPLDVVRAVVEIGRGARRSSGRPWSRSTGPPWPSPRSTAASASPSSRPRWSSRNSAGPSPPGPCWPRSPSSPRWSARSARPSSASASSPSVAAGTLTGTVALADHPRGWALDDVTMTGRASRGRMGPRRHQARRPGRRRRRRGRRRRPGGRRRGCLRRPRWPRPASPRSTRSMPAGPSPPSPWTGCSSPTTARWASPGAPPRRPASPGPWRRRRSRSRSRRSAPATRSSRWCWPT